MCNTFQFFTSIFVPFFFLFFHHLLICFPLLGSCFKTSYILPFWILLWRNEGIFCFVSPCSTCSSANLIKKFPSIDIWWLPFEAYKFQLNLNLSPGKCYRKKRRKTYDQYKWLHFCHIGCQQPFFICIKLERWSCFQGFLFYCLNIFNRSICSEYYGVPPACCFFILNHSHHYFEP